MFDVVNVERVVKDLKINPRSKIRCRDLESLVEFAGTINSLIKRHRAGCMMASCYLIMHTLDNMNCTKDVMV